MSSDTLRMFGLPLGWARGLLLASLILNFLTVGLVAGAALKSSDRRMGTTGFMIQSILEVADDAHRSDIRNRLSEHRTGTEDRRRSSHEAWGRLTESLRQTPFQPEATMAIFREMRDLRDTSRAHAYQIITEALTAMEDAERAELADRLATFMNNRGNQR